jgi:hypothetical protein
VFIRKRKAWKNEQPAPDPAALAETVESYPLAIHSIVMVRPKSSCANTVPGANRRSIDHVVSQLIRRHWRLGFDGSASLLFRDSSAVALACGSDVHPDASVSRNVWASLRFAPATLKILVLYSQCSAWFEFAQYRSSHRFAAVQVPGAESFRRPAVGDLPGIELPQLTI